jgi:hypothetical protein
VSLIWKVVVVTEVTENCWSCITGAVRELRGMRTSAIGTATRRLAKLSGLSVCCSNCIACEIAISSELIIVTSCKRAVNPITNPKTSSVTQWRDNIFHSSIPERSPSEPAWKSISSLRLDQWIGYHFVRIFVSSRSLYSFWDFFSPLPTTVMSHFLHRKDCPSRSTYLRNSKLNSFTLSQILPIGFRSGW